MLNDFPIHHELYLPHLGPHLADISMTSGLCLPLDQQNYGSELPDAYQAQSLGMAACDFVGATSNALEQTDRQIKQY
jgi:hypothetical protein